MNRYRLFSAVAVGAIALDQASKIYARHVLPGESIRITVVDGYFDWMLAHNTGSAFSLFSGGIGSRIVLSVVASIAIGAIIWMVRSAKDSQRGLVFGLGLMAGGALGNLADRIWFGQVTDFVLWHYKDHYWPVFNVADVVLVLAVPLFLIYGYRSERNAASSLLPSRDADSMADSAG